MRRKDIVNAINDLEKNLAMVSAKLNKYKKMVPDGASLRVVKHGKGHQYFMRVKGGGKNGLYIKKGELEMAEALAQVEYHENLKMKLATALDDLRKCHLSWQDDPFETAMRDMIPSKREFVDDSCLSVTRFLAEWREQEYEGLSFREDAPEYYSRNGLRVRSKSEVIIADILDDLNIPFLYEKPIKVGGEKFHPDFTMLDVKEKRDVYWEHFGMMDDSDYRNSAFYKIRKYEANGIFQYDSLICTFETGSYPLNTRAIRNMAIRLKEKLGYC